MNVKISLYSLDLTNITVHAFAFFRTRPRVTCARHNRVHESGASVRRAAHPGGPDHYSAGRGRAAADASGCRRRLVPRRSSVGWRLWGRAGAGRGGLVRTGANIDSTVLIIITNATAGENGKYSPAADPRPRAETSTVDPQPPVVVPDRPSPRRTRDAPSPGGPGPVSRSSRRAAS